MKKITLHTTALCFLAVLTQAQPSLLSSEMLPFGSVMTEKSVMNLTVVDTTIQGAGVTWNFSAFTNNTSNPDLVVNIVNPSTTPYASNFPSANYGYKEVQGAATNYRYFSLTTAKMERVGSYVSNVNTYTDPQVEYVFPLALGTTNYDTWANTNSSTGGTYDLKCVGTGTLIIPSGSYNALLVRVHLTESFIDIYAYYWYSSDNGAILVSYIAGDGFFIAESAYYLGSLSIDVEENEFITDIRYNNPVENEFTLYFESKSNAVYAYDVMNATGQNILEGSLESINGNTEKLSVDFSNLRSGIYFFSIRPENSGQKPKTLKIVKQ